MSTNGKGSLNNRVKNWNSYRENGTAIKGFGKKWAADHDVKSDINNPIYNAIFDEESTQKQCNCINSCEDCNQG